MKVVATIVVAALVSAVAATSTAATTELRPGIASAFLRSLPPAVVEERRTNALWAPAWGGGQAGRRAGGQWSRWGEESTPARPSAQSPVSAPEETSQLAPRYVKGERVRHRRFGSGTIRGLTGGGRDLSLRQARKSFTIYPRSLSK